MLDQAAIFARAADALAPPPPPPPEPAWRRFFEAAQKLAERDRREAADTRTEAQRWLNDPGHGVSAKKFTTTPHYRSANFISC